MFRKVFQSLSRSLGSSKSPKAPPRSVSEGSVLEKMIKQKGVPQRAPAEAAAGAETAEQLCGITRGMSKPEIAARLKKLYRRYNRAASSLDAKLRAESERMLDAIVEVREKHFGLI